MVGAGFHVYAVWDYCITKNRSGLVELNPKLLAFILDGDKEGSEGKVAEAIEFLCRADPKSRSKDLEGRRLIKEGEYQYRMVNWGAYEKIRSIEDLREYNRRKQAEYRARKRANRKPRVAGGQGAEAAYVKAEGNGATPEQLDRIVTESLPDGLR